MWNPFRRRPTEPTLPPAGGDRQLVNRIKKHFAGKSAAQLQQIVLAGVNDRWSAEAITAASEVLLDRANGRAAEPTTVEEDTSPSPPGHTVDSIAAIVGLNLLTMPFGVVVLPSDRTHEEDPVVSDIPVPFGPGLAWLAVETVDTAEVVAAIGLRKVREATWEAGTKAAYGSAVFVTPPLGDWTLVASGSLLPPRGTKEFVKPLVERLSHKFGDAQYFCTHNGVGLHVWARARSGRLVRGFGWYGQSRLTLWDEGTPTKEERQVGLRLSLNTSPEGQQGQENEILPDEEGVTRLASCWSVDPTTLDDHFKEQVYGRVGESTWSVAEPIAGPDPARLRASPGGEGRKG